MYTIIIKPTIYICFSIHVCNNYTPTQHALNKKNLEKQTKKNLFLYVILYQIYNLKIL